MQTYGANYTLMDNAKIDSCKVAAAQLVGNGAQAVVGVEAPAQLEAHLARSEVDLVVDHQDLLGRHTVGAGQL